MPIALPLSLHYYAICVASLFIIAAFLITLIIFIMPIALPLSLHYYAICVASLLLLHFVFRITPLLCAVIIHVQHVQW